MRFYMRISVIVISVSKLAIKLYQNLLLISFFIFLFFFFFFARGALSLVDRKGLGKCGWTVCDVLYKTIIVEVAGRPCMHIIAFSGFSLESLL